MGNSMPQVPVAQCVRPFVNPDEQFYTSNEDTHIVDKIRTDLTTTSVFSYVRMYHFFVNIDTHDTFISSNTKGLTGLIKKRRQ